MREEFEKEYRKRSSDRLSEDVEQSLLIGSDGEYVFGLTWTAFYWWQAATALQAERVRELEEKINDIWACANSGYSLEDLKAKIALSATAREEQSCKS